MPHDWIDISIPLHNSMPRWPDNPPVEINRTMDVNRGDEATVSTISNPKEMFNRRQGRIAVCI